MASTQLHSIASKTVSITPNTVSVWSFPERAEPAVRISHNYKTILVRDLLNIVAKTLGVRETNVKCFAIFKGLINPTKKFEENDEITLPFADVLSIQKWSFDVEEEKKAVNTDMATLRLMRMQAMSIIQSGHLKASKEDIARLEEYCKSNFSVDKQYMEVIHSLPSYAAVIIENCIVVTEISISRVSFKQGAKISVQADKQGMLLKSDNLQFLILWSSLRSMDKVKSDILEYEIFFPLHEILKWIRLQTLQADYLMSVTSELLKRNNEETTTCITSSKTRSSRKHEETKTIRGHEQFSKISKNIEYVDFDEF